MTPARDHEGESLPRAVGPRVEWDRDAVLEDVDGDSIVVSMVDRTDTEGDPPLLALVFDDQQRDLDEAGVRALIGSLWSGWQRLTASTDG